MHDSEVEEIMVSFKGDRMLLRWKYPDKPHQYKWFPVDV